MPLMPPQEYRNVEYIHRRGLASARPAAADVLAGTLYFSTDTGVTERSTGSAWESYSGSSDLVVIVTPSGWVGTDAAMYGTVNSLPCWVLQNSIAQAVRISCVIPKGATSISAIKIIFNNEVISGSVNLYLRLLTSYQPPNAGGAVSTDYDDTFKTYAISTYDTTGIITFPSGSYDAHAITERGLLAAYITRDAAHASDTFEANWRITGIRFEFN